MSPPDEQLVVSTYSARRQRLDQLVRWVVVTVVFVVGFVLGSQIFEGEMSAKRQLDIDHKALLAERDVLSQQLMNAEVAAEVDRAALEQVRKTVVGLQEQLTSGEEELELYRNLMRDDSLPEGLSLRELSLTVLVEGGIAYRLVVQNKTSSLKAMDVRVNLSVEGELAGESKTVALHELDEKLDKSPLAMKFKYFGVQQGTLQLPDGFEAKLVHVSMWKAGQRKKVEKLFDWEIENY